MKYSSRDKFAYISQMPWAKSLRTTLVKYRVSFVNQGLYVRFDFVLQVFVPGLN